MNEITRIIIVDDHKIFRIGLETILNNIKNVKVVASVNNAKQLLNILKKQSAEIIFMDIKMPDMDGIEATKRVLEKYNDISIIALSLFSEIEYFNKMVDAGASGYVLKNTDDEELEEAIKKVAQGYTYFSEDFRKNPIIEENKPIKCKIKLSKREIEVLTLICQGLSNSEIATKLFLSSHTIDGHRRNLLSKVGAKNSPSLVMFAMKNNLINI